jgi:hypothetical protein
MIFARAGRRFVQPRSLTLFGGHSFLAQFSCLALLSQRHKKQG